ncbi:MAG: hypothetical protein AAGI15_02610 [Pseudomonadota bacterium]
MSDREPMTVCHTPTPGKQPTRIPSWKYEVVREHILAIVPQQAPGIPAKDLAGLVAKRMDSNTRARLGSVGWHTVTVKLNMEVDGELQRVANARPQHLVRL